MDLLQHLRAEGERAGERAAAELPAALLLANVAVRGQEQLQLALDLAGRRRALGDLAHHVLVGVHGEAGGGKIMDL